MCPLLETGHILHSRERKRLFPDDLLQAHQPIAEDPSALESKDEKLETQEIMELLLKAVLWNTFV